MFNVMTEHTESVSPGYMYLYRTICYSPTLAKPHI